MKLMLALALLAISSCFVCGCRKNEVIRKCEACIEKEGQMFCGSSLTNLNKHPDIDEDASKLGAARGACVEFGARKGGGYAGPLYKQAMEACAQTVKAKDLRRARCEDLVNRDVWNPREGVDAL